VIDHLVALSDDLSGLRMDHRAGEQAAVQAAGHRLPGHIVGAPDGNSLGSPAVDLIDNDVLRDVYQASSQVAGVRGAQGGICQTLARAVC
jgi:hypothetical protein